MMGMIVTPLFGFLSHRLGLLNLIRIGATTGIIGILLSGAEGVLWIVLGLLLFTGGHFTAHSAASSWIGSKAKQGKGAASGMYLVSYYTGGSLGSTLLGYIWSEWNWSGVKWVVILILAFVLPLTLILSKQERRMSKWETENHR
ncbi:MFS transporter [Microaerobacter geothermalis]|uniref:hypothetical protein n=1 Tax=Microaerobacter geothermalis TaxID=674972 RepID=UPI002E318FC9|nr:hypothetical protein [Microaerobacter geothermalis]